MAAKKKTSKRKPAQPDEPSPGPGRPTAYRPEFPEIARRLYSQGATDIEVADELGIAVCQLYVWRYKHPEFAEATKLGKEPADERVESSLYNRAVGYSFDSVKIFPGGALGPVIVPYREHVPPDVGAAAKWLANRRPERWRDTQKHDHSHHFDVGSSDDLEERLAAALRARTAGPAA